MDFSAVCRTCLSNSCLYPIFSNTDDHKKYSNAIFVATGVKIELNDGLPQNMCTSCITFLNNSLKFRQRCKETENELSKTKTVSGNETTETKFNVTTSEDKLNKANMKLLQEIAIKVELISNKELVKAEIKPEYTNYELLDDEDDKPLKYLIESDAENVEDNFVVFIDNSYEDKEETQKLKKDISAAAEPENPPYHPFTDDMDPKRKRVTCKLCQKNLSVRSIDTHMARSHPGADERKTKCELCDSYVTKEKMNRHQKLMHGSEKVLRCGYCKSEFDSKEVLVEHVAACTAKKKKRKVSETGRQLRECDVCHKIMQKASLRMHKAIKHAGLGPVCEHCGRRFGNKFRLDEHYRAKHGYDKFKCTYCDFQSAGVMAMRNHERRHRGEKPFVCDTCGAKFHAAYLLAQHKQSHRTEKLIKCNLCPATFKANNSLHMHKITCHSTSLYKCTMCSRAYSCRHYAVKHIRHVHDFKGPVPPLQRIANDVASSIV